MTFNRLLKPLLVAALALNVASAIYLVPEAGKKPAANSRLPSTSIGDGLCGEHSPKSTRLASDAAH
jgi:hypothetical protein